MSEHSLALPEGYRLKEYVIQGTLGYGGFGITYRAHDTLLDKVVAIKEYLPSELAVRIEGSTVVARSDGDLEGFEWGRQRFLDEARTVARFDHPNIIRIHRFFEENGTGYIVMEFVDGRPLSAVLADYGPQVESDINAWLWPILDGLKVVHQDNFLHRDIKPHNIMIRRDGSPVLLDFGAARAAMGGHTRSLTSILTPGYAPLEQYQTRGNQGPWTDIYALGAVAYYCMAGRKPIDALDRVIEDKIQPPDADPTRPYSRALVSGVMTALNVREDDRPKDIDQWSNMLRDQDADATRIMRPEDVAPGATEKPPGQPVENGQSAVADSAKPTRRLLIFAMVLVPVIVAAGLWFSGVLRQAPVDTPVQDSTQTGESTVQSPEPEPPPEPVRQVEEGGEIETSRPEEAATGESMPQQVAGQDSSDTEIVLPAEPEDAAPEPPTATYALTIEPDPSNALVRFLNVDQTYQPGIMLEPGRYEVEVSKEGYRSVTRTLEIFDQARTIPIRLRPEQIEAQNTQPVSEPVSRPSGESPTAVDNAPSLVIITGCDDKNPTRSVDPVFPQAARSAGIEGKVTLEFTVDPDGSVVNPRIRTAEPAGFFEDAALEAIKQFRYRPNSIGGQNHPCLSSQELRFELGN